MDENTYDALDAWLEALIRIAEQFDYEKIEKLVEYAPKIEKLMGLLEKIDDETIASLEKLISILPLVASKLDAIVPCVEKALQSIETAEPTVGLKGLLKLLRDKEVQEGIGKVAAILRVFGKCEF